jgi:hypothetical protein
LESSPYLPGKPKPRGESLAELLVSFGTGAAGLGTAAASGEPLAGVGAGVAANRLGTGLLRFLQRGDDRAQRTMQHAARRFEERHAGGEKPGPNSFQGESATEAVEATIKAAANSVEQRKACLIGSLLASAAYELDLPIADLLRFLKLLEALSWRQILALAYFADEARAPERVLIAAGGPEGIGQIQPGLEAELAELGRGHELIGFVGDDGGVANPSNVWNGGQITAADIDTVGLTRLGKTIFRLAEMDREIKPGDLDQFTQAEITG